MTDCSQLQPQLDELTATLAVISKPNYCKEQYPDDLNDRKTCENGIGAQIEDVKTGIRDLRYQIIICSVLIGTWVINATVHDNSGNTVDSPDYSGQLTIGSWDTNSGMLGGRIDVPVQSSDFPIPQGLNYIIATFQADTLKLDISIANPPLLYDGTLDLGTGVMTGIVEGEVDVLGQFPSWSARKLG